MKIRPPPFKIVQTYKRAQKNFKRLFPFFIKKTEATTLAPV